ncbi:MAG: formyltransferase family protein [Pseudomonadota bacterium]
MPASTPRFAFVLSTPGSVLQRVLETATVRAATHLVIATQDGPALQKARASGINTAVIADSANETFCAKVLDHVLEHRIDYILSFYTKFYSQTIRDALQDRIVNFHPSLLPAFKGMDGFGDGLAYHTKIIGTTVELIKDNMDEGKIVMQTACAVDINVSREEMRHRIFVQQCKTLIQVIDWITKGRMNVEGGKVTIYDAWFRDPEFSPALENAEAIAFGQASVQTNLTSTGS